MEKYKQMLEKNKQISLEKVEIAINCINDLVKNEQQVVVSTLVKRQDCQEHFFTKNQVVRSALNKAQNLQKNKNFVKKQSVAINKSMEKEIEILKAKLREKDEKIRLLENENKKLQKLQNQKNCQFLRNYKEITSEKS